MDDEHAYELIKSFLVFLDRSIPGFLLSYESGTGSNQGGEVIVEIETELQNAIPAITLLYDPDITPDDFAKKCVLCALSWCKTKFCKSQRV